MNESWTSVSGYDEERSENVGKRWDTSFHAESFERRYEARGERGDVNADRRRSEKEAGEFLDLKFGATGRRAPS